MGLRELKQELREAVVGKWIGRERVPDREALADAAEGIGIVGPAGHFAKCAREARPIVECYAEKGADLSAKYRELWQT